MTHPLPLLLLCCSDREDAYQRMDVLIQSLVSRIEERRTKYCQVPKTLQVSLRQRVFPGIHHQKGTSGESRQCSIPNPETLFSRSGKCKF